MNPHGFTDLRDESMKLMDFDARYYDSTIGCFISADTLVPGYENPQALNRYSYALNNPVKYRDPSGHCVDGITTVFCIAALGAGVAFIADFTAQFIENREAGIPFWEAGYHENIDTQELAVTTALGGASGAAAVTVVPAIGAIAGSAATGVVSTLGATEATAITIGTGATVGGEIFASGATNAVLGSTKRMYELRQNGGEVTSDVFVEDLMYHSGEDFKMGLYSGALGQATKGSINYVMGAPSDSPVLKTLDLGGRVVSSAPPQMSGKEFQNIAYGASQTGAWIASSTDVLSLLERGIFE